MKQVLQHLRSGETEVADVPAPLVRPGHLLIQTARSLISAGTERSLVEFGKSSYLAKARSQPDKVKQVLEKIKTDGLLPTLEAVFNKLDEPLPLGYCNAGVVLEVGAGVTGFAPGDRVISNGAHAELVCIPQNLCAKAPDGVSHDQAAFAVLASVGLQGIRLLQPTLGERFVVYGLGLIGLISVQLLRAHGCEVLGVDVHPDRLRLAEASGAVVVNAAGGADPVVVAGAWAGGKGVDGVLITASAKTDDIVHQAAQMCRRRGRIVLVGVVGLNLMRADFYEKELSFQVSCSYGPGRYDEKYEQAGHDYPVGFVRWTEQRNFEAILGALATGRLNVDALITHRFPIARAADAYQVITSDPNGMAVLLEYPAEVERAPRVQIAQPAAAPTGRVTAGVIGAGIFSKFYLTPLIVKAGARLKYVADLNSAAAQHLAHKHGGEQAVTDYQLILADPEVNVVLIAVGHNLHARFVCEGLAAGKHVYVEKPLAMNAEELERVTAALQKAPGRQLMVGFNRRFAPHIVRLRQLLAGRGEPLCLNMTANAGYLPPDHWTQDPVRGGGRIIGEACHFMDLLAFLAGAPITAVSAMMVGRGPAIREDKMSIAMSFGDGSVGTVNYFSNGSKRYPKETLEVFSDGRVLRLDNFRRLVGYGVRGFTQMKSMRQNKGHEPEFAAFVERLGAGGPPLITFDELRNVTLASFAAVESARTGQTVHL
jgi:predicted dehydrogenase/threonine dehydrogenase-like Zn-dependent dehydrogenase